MPPRIEQLVLEPFKNYLLIDHIVDGGMGAIFRARFLDESMAKIVTIKMIKEKFSQDEQFKKLFMNEIRVTFPLIHPNIAQTYEYGEFEGKLFTVMEYVDGRNLKEYLVRLRALKFAFPVEVSVFIMAEVCKGLNYAHSMKDQLTGKPLNIIHRDISPQNIMLTFDGSVKVIDFGIAKADTNEDKTKTGVIKGKLSYLAPEYLTGEGLDPRYDQFAAGIVLWEMLCGRQLFSGKTDMDKMVKIHACNIPRPSSINPRVPKDLDRIVIKALSRNPENRFGDMEQFNRALVRSLYANFPNFSPTDLSKFGPKLFAKEIEEDRKIFQMISKPGFMDAIIAKMPAEARSGIGPQESISSYVEESEHTKEQLASVSSPPNIPLPDLDEDFEDSEDSVSEVQAKGQSSSDKSAAKVIELELEGAESDDEDEEDEASSLTSPVILVAGAIILAVLGFAYFKWTGGDKSEIANEALFERQSDQERAARSATPAAQATNTTTTGMLKISNLDLVGERLFINGELKDVGYFRELAVPLDTELVLRIERDNYATYIERIKLTSEKPSLEIVIPQRPALSFGYLVTGQNCVQGKIFFDLFGEDRIENLPIDLYQNRIAFPLNRNEEGYTIATSYDVQVRLEGSNARKNIKLQFENDFQKLDLCQIIEEQK